MAQLQQRTITGRDFLISCCDGGFNAVFLGENGLAFTLMYYDQLSPFVKEHGDYMHDYASVFDNYDDIYFVEDTWESYERIAPVITRQFNEWLEWCSIPSNLAMVYSRQKSEILYAHSK